MGFWRSLYYYMEWEYHSENDNWDERQKHLKHLCTKQIETLDINKFFVYHTLNKSLEDL